MGKNLLGLEIGNHTLKMAVCSGKNLQKLVTAQLPDNLVRDDSIVSWEAMTDFLKEVIKKNRISCKNTYLVLPEKIIYYKRVSMPAMTTEQLKVNLPYEFHDYISDEKDKYFYDYAVLEHVKDDKGTVKEIDLVAVAVLKDYIEKYKALCRKAGLKLIAIGPEFSSFKRILNSYEKTINERGERDYAFLDIGHEAVRLKFFTKGNFEVTRVMEPGISALTRIVGDIYETDMHIAQVYKEQNHDGVLERDECKALYNQLAVEIMRVLNFYNFNHPDNTLDTVYVCGGGALIEPLLKEIQDNIEIKLKTLDEMFVLGGNSGKKDDLLVGAAAIGTTWV